MKTILITGVTGMDGAILAHQLIEDNKVVGLHRRSSVNNFQRIADIQNHSNLELVEGDITDSLSVSGVISEYKPDWVFNTAAMSHVHTSFEQPTYTSMVNYMGVQYLLDAIRVYSPETRMLQCSTSEMFGNNYSQGCSIQYNEVGAAVKAELTRTPYIGPHTDLGVRYQDENTAFAPASPYAVSKVAAHHLCQLYRRAYNLHVNCSITFNHEHETRGENFVTRKITRWVAEFDKWRNQEFKTIGYLNIPDDTICYGKPRFGPIFFPKLRLGNLDAKRDWGYAEDYTEAFIKMLQQDKPGDYVIATGETHSVKEFLDVAFAEIGIEKWDDFVVVDPKFYRPEDVHYLLGDASKARRELGWKPRVGFTELVQMMVQHDIQHG